MAQTCPVLRAIAANVSPPDTASGVADDTTLLPAPSWPRALLPQQNAAPAVVRPHVPFVPAPSNLNVRPPTTRVGVVRVVVVLSPSCPELFTPQQNAAPVAVRPQE